MEKKEGEGKSVSKTLGAEGQAQKQQQGQTSDKNADHAIIKNAHEVFNKNIPELKCNPKRNRTSVQSNNNYFSEKDINRAIKQSIRDTNDTNDKFNKISNKMKKRSLEMHNVKADGNCFFVQFLTKSLGTRNYTFKLE